MSRSHIFAPIFGALALLLAAPALAEDGDEEESSGGLFGVGPLNFDIDDGPRGAEIAYSGSTEDSAPDYAPGTSVTITHTAGPVKVHCTDRKGISARINYTIRGTVEGPMEAVGKGVLLKAWGGTSGGGVKTVVPAKRSGVNKVETDLTVFLPYKANVTVVGGTGGAEVTGCTGWVKISARDGVYADGTLSHIELTASSGDARAELTDESVLSGANKLSAVGGNVKLILPRAYAGKIYAKAAEVQVAPPVDGSTTPSLVSGTIGGGGAASMTLTGKESVTVSLP